MASDRVSPFIIERSMREALLAAIQMAGDMIAAALHVPAFGAELAEAGDASRTRP